MDFSIERVKDSISGMFKGKKKFVIIGGIALVVVLVLMRKKTTTDETASSTLISSGYPATQAGTSGGDTSTSEVDLTGVSADFTSQITALANSLASTLNEQNQTFNGKITDLNNTNTSLNNSLTGLQKDNLSLSNSLSGLQNDNLSLADSLLGLSGKNSSLEQSLNALSTANQGLNTQIAGLKNSFSETVATNQSAYQSTLAALQEKLAASAITAPLVVAAAPSNSWNGMNEYPSSPVVGDFTVVSPNQTSQTYYQPPQGQAYQTSDAATLAANYAITHPNQTAADQAIVAGNIAKVDAIAEKAKGVIWNGSAWVTP